MKRLALALTLAVSSCAQRSGTTRREPEPTTPPAASPAAPAPESEARSGAAQMREAAAVVRRAPSGAQLLQLPLDQSAIVNVQFSFRSGAVDDPRGKAGLTALTARLMVEGGTQTLDAKALSEALFPLAAEMDARVDKELTTFRVRVHRDNLAKLLPIATDVLLHPRWDPAEFRRLRDAAVNDVEKRLRQGDDENLGKEALYELMYRDHPYGRLTLGHVADLRSISLEEVKAHAAHIFTADRLTAGVSGGAPEDLAQRLVQAVSALPSTSEAPQEIAQRKPHGPRFFLIEKAADSTAISMGMPWALSHKDPDWPALSVARSAFGEHRQVQGRLMQRLREARGLNYGDYAYLEHFEQEGDDAATAQTGRARHQQDFTIWLRPVRNENRLFAVRAALYELSRSLREEPFSAGEVERTRGFLDGYILLFDQTDARKLGYALDDAFYGMSGFLASWRAALRNVTTEQVNAAWRKWIDPARLQIVMAGPDTPSLRKTLLSGEPTPMQYQKDATGTTPQKSAEQLATDRQIEAFPLGVQGDADVEVVPVEKMFE